MKKIFLTFVVALAIALMLAFAVSADSVHNENTVDYDETVTLNDGTVLPLYDQDREALIWYISGTDGSGKNIYSSVRADSSLVKWNTKSWGEVTSVSILLDNGTKYGSGTFVVVNMMDDDVISNTPEGDHTNFGQPIKSFKWLFSGAKKLEYVYLRLDTDGIFAQSFNGCSALKYINFEDLTSWKNSRDGQQFSGCSSLFPGQVLDLSHTQLITLNGGGTLAGVPIVGLKLPSTVTSLGDWVFQGNPNTYFMFPENIATMPTNAFKNCTNLQTVYVNGTTTSIGDNAFLSCNNLKKICFVGTKDQLKTLIASTSATGNDAFFSVAGALGENGEYANVISYADYLKLSNEQKSSGKYAIYNYSYCEAYNNGVHTAVDNANDCTKNADCRVCGLEEAIEAEFENHNYLETLVYENGFAQAGVYKYICQNSEKCTCGNITASKDAIFVAIGFSTKGTDGISAGYSVVPELVTEYNRINKDNKITFGVMMVSPTFLSEKDSFFKDGKVNAEKYLQVDMTGIAYKNLSVHVTGFVDTARNASLVMALYVCDGDGNVEFVQSQITPCADKSVTLGNTTLYTVTLDSVTNESTTVGNLKDYFAKEEEE